MNQNPKKSGEESKNGSGRGDPNRSYTFFKLYHCLSVFVCSVDTWEKE